MKLEEIKKLNLFERLLKISEEVGTVGKNLVIKLGSGGYKAVAEVDVIYAVKPLEIKYRIFSYPVKHEVVESKELEREITRSGNTYTVIDQFVRVKVLYRFVNVDNPSEYIDIEMLGDGVDSGDKTSGKAQTYADKYALLKGYKIPTGDDPDQEASNDYKTSRKTTPKVAPTVDRKMLEEQFMFLANEEQLEKTKQQFGDDIPGAIPLNVLERMVEKLQK